VKHEANRPLVVLALGHVEELRLRIRALEKRHIGRPPEGSFEARDDDRLALPVGRRDRDVLADQTLNRR